MAAQISEELEDQIVERLTGAEDENDIILDICEKTGLGWADVQAEVERLKLENKDEIVVGQSPLLMISALFIFLTGLGLMGYSIYQAVLYYSGFSATFVLYLSVSIQGVIGTFILGLAMMIGSLKGMSTVWESIFAWIGKLSE